MLPFPWKHSHLFPSTSQPWNWIDHPISKCREYVYTRAADGKCLTLFVRIRHVRQVVLLVVINHQFRYYIAIPEINTLTHFISFIYKKKCTKYRRTHIPRKRSTWWWCIVVVASVDDVLCFSIANAVSSSTACDWVGRYVDAEEEDRGVEDAVPRGVAQRTALQNLDRLLTRAGS